MSALATAANARRRPAVVTIMAVLDLFGAAVGLAAVVLVFARGEIGGVDFRERFVVAQVGVIATFFSGWRVLWAVSVLSFATGIGLLGGKAWAWTIAVIATATAIPALVAAPFLGEGIDIITLPLSVFFLWALFQPNTTAFFGLATVHPFWKRSGMAQT